MDRSRAVGSHDRVLAVVIGGELCLEGLDIMVGVFVPTVAHRVFDDANLVFGDPRSRHVYLARLELQWPRSFSRDMAADGPAAQLRHLHFARASRSNSHIELIWTKTLAMPRNLDLYDRCKRQ